MRFKEFNIRIKSEDNDLTGEQGTESIRPISIDLDKVTAFYETYHSVDGTNGTSVSVEGSGEFFLEITYEAFKKLFTFCYNHS